MFENNRWIIDNMLGISGDKFVIRENISPESIETCNGVAIRDEKTRTCELCVALNYTVFKNNNKPQYYHPNCKCTISRYELLEVECHFPFEKITRYLFFNKNKKAMMRKMGYTIENAQEVYNIVKSAVEKKFLLGEYELKDLNIHGQHFEINVMLKGKREYEGQVFACHVGCVAWPFGKIKIATPMIKDKEIV